MGSTLVYKSRIAKDSYGLSNTATKSDVVFRIKSAPQLFSGFFTKSVAVTLADGSVSAAWTYLYNWPVTELPRIASGKFLEH